MHYKMPTAVFDVFVDDELRTTFEAESRFDAGRIATEQMPEVNTLAYQGRVKIIARDDHEHWPSAGNISVCVFCQARINKETS